MKKIALLLTIICAGQLYGMEAERIGDLPKELQREITQAAIASSNTLDEAIAMIKKLSASFGVQHDKLFANLEDFTKLVHMVSNKFNLSTKKIAQKFNTPTSEEYVKLGDKLINCIYEAELPLTIYLKRMAQLIEQGADVNYSQVNSDANTVLHEAMFYRSPEMVQLLVKYGVNSKVVLDDARSILEITGHDDGLEKIIKLLEEAMKKEQ